MRRNANTVLDNESVSPRMKAKKSEEACGMRVRSLKKDVFKKDNMQKGERWGI